MSDSEKKKDKHSKKEMDEITKNLENVINVDIIDETELLQMPSPEQVKQKIYKKISTQKSLRKTPKSKKTTTFF